MTESFFLPIVPRYAEVDQQGVVFHGHYLTWFDEASTAYLDHLGIPITDMTSAGLDVQVVHTEIDFSNPVRWRDAVRITARCESLGTTSFTLAFEAIRSDADGADVTAVRGRTVYVVVSTDDWAKRPIPPALRSALTSVVGQRQNPPTDGPRRGTVGP